MFIYTNIKYLQMNEQGTHLDSQGMVQIGLFFLLAFSTDPGPEIEN